MNWENAISINSDKEINDDKLQPAINFVDSASERWSDLNYTNVLNSDTDPLPTTEHREGYYSDDHFSYWASGLEDARKLIDFATEEGVGVDSFLDIGCASGRVIRHLSRLLPKSSVWGTDINRLHVEWCLKHLSKIDGAFCCTSIPNLPIESNSIDVISAYSVFTHIEAFETMWLMEMRRILKKGAVAWITVHTEKTLEMMDETWPLWRPIMEHPMAKKTLDKNRQFKGNRVIFRWHMDNSYTSNVFYKKSYIEKAWQKFFKVLEFRDSGYQVSLLLKKY